MLGEIEAEGEALGDTEELIDGLIEAEGEALDDTLGLTDGDIEDDPPRTSKL